MQTLTENRPAAAFDMVKAMKAEAAVLWTAAGFPPQLTYGFYRRDGQLVRSPYTRDELLHEAVQLEADADLILG